MAMELAGLILGCTQLVIPLVNMIAKVKSASQDKEKLLEELSQAYTLLRTIGNHELETDSVKILGEAGGILEKYRVLLNDLTQKFTEHNHLRPEMRHDKTTYHRIRRWFSWKLSSLKWPFEQEEVMHALELMQRYNHLIQLAYNHDVRGLISTVAREGLPRIEARVEAQHQILDEALLRVQEIQEMVSRPSSSLTLRSENETDRPAEPDLDWLRPLEMETRHIDMSQQWQEGTGQWLLQTLEFEGWVGGEYKMLLCEGIPGAGKSVMASVIINHLRSKFQKEPVGVAFLYCDYKLGTVQHAHELIATLIYQLAKISCTHSFKRARSAVNGLTNKFPTLLEDLKNAQNSHSMEALQQVLCNVSTDFSHIYIVIDAFDECRYGNYLLPCMRNFVLNAKGSNVSLLITSREIGIQDSLKDCAHARLVIRATDHDVTTFVTKQIGRRHRLSSLCSNCPQLLSELVDGVTSKAHGMFLLAALHLDAIESQTSRTKVRSALKRLPRSLKGTYDQALERIMRQGDEDRQLAMDALMWISCASQPMTISALCQALVLTADRSLRRIHQDDMPPMSKGDRRVSLAHYTTQKHLEENKSRYFHDASIKMASACLRGLMYLEGTFSKEDLFAQLGSRNSRRASENWVERDHSMLYVPSIRAFVAQVGPGRLNCYSFAEYWIWARNRNQQHRRHHPLLNRDIQPFSIYAAMCWLVHVRNCLDHVYNCEVVNLLDDFLCMFPVVYIVTLQERFDFTQCEYFADFSDFKWPREYLAVKFGLSSYLKGRLSQNTFTPSKLDRWRREFGLYPRAFFIAAAEHRECGITMLQHLWDSYRGLDHRYMEPVLQYALNAACDNLNIEALRWLLSRADVDPNYIFPSDSGALCPLAILANNPTTYRHHTGQLREKALAIFLSRPDINLAVRDSRRQPPLYHALLKGSIVFIKMLLEREGVSLDMSGPKSDTPSESSIASTKVLASAIAETWTYIGSRLLTNPNLKLDRYTWLGLMHIAISQENLQLVQSLLSLLAWDPSFSPVPAFKSHFACKCAPLVCVSKCIAEVAGNQPATSISISETLLDWLSSRVKPKATKANRLSGDVPLSAAVLRGNRKLVELRSTDSNVNPNARDCDSGRTALHKVAIGVRNQPDTESTNRREALRQLLDPKASIEPDVKDYKGRTPLSYAAEYGLLETRNVDMLRKDKNGLTPAHYAASSSNNVRALLEPKKLLPMDLIMRTRRN
ncbi:hypothetical protein BDZ91DRAFT_742707 [Kalaharituber pfeilii]|nr:hypothetical protein BDZ91DRAFT_742707 [Kalaharituber pfeilii]